MYPGNSRILQGMVVAYARAGRYDDALDVNEKRTDRQIHDKTLTRSSLLAQAGRADEARQILEGLLLNAPEEELSPFRVAVCFAFLNEADKAFEWLERSYESRAFGMYQIKIAPAFEPLHGDPRYKDLLRRMNLPE
jgi:tetratricopeptide (TPR) repeat protein